METQMSIRWARQCRLTVFHLEKPVCSASIGKQGATGPRCVLSQDTVSPLHSLKLLPLSQVLLGWFHPGLNPSFPGWHEGIEDNRQLEIWSYWVSALEFSGAPTETNNSPNSAWRLHCQSSLWAPFGRNWAVKEGSGSLQCWYNCLEPLGLQSWISKEKPPRMWFTSF